LLKVRISLMVLQIVALVGPAKTPGLLGAKKKLMGDHLLRGSNKVVYWIW